MSVHCITSLIAIISVPYKTLEYLALKATASIRFREKTCCILSEMKRQHNAFLFRRHNRPGSCVLAFQHRTPTDTIPRATVLRIPCLMRVWAETQHCIYVREAGIHILIMQPDSNVWYYKHATPE